MHQPEIQVFAPSATAGLGVPRPLGFRIINDRREAQPCETFAMKSWRMVSSRFKAAMSRNKTEKCPYPHQNAAFKVWALRTGDRVLTVHRIYPSVERRRNQGLE